MKRFVSVSFVIAVLALPFAAEASTVTLTDWTSGDFAANASGGGGPFLATTSPDSTLGSFLTFCIEYNEHFSYGTPYNFVLSDGAVSGGVSGGNPDPLSDATKWLYYETVSGDYATWFGTATGAALASAGSNFQLAIWYLEGERTLAEIGGASSAAYLTAQYATTNQNWAGLYAGGHRVYGMNLTTLAGGPAQDQLAYEQLRVPQQPVPEPASLLLLGSGLVLAARRMRRRRG